MPRDTQLEPATRLDVNARRLQPYAQWARAEQLLAVIGVAVVAMRLPLTQQLLTLGDLMVIATAPIWFPVTRRYVAARMWLLLGFLCIPAGAILSSLNAVDHQIRLGNSITSTVLMLSLLCSVGFLLWAREHLSSGALVAAYGLGLMFGLATTTTSLFPTNPWKYGFALPVTLVLFGLAQMSKRRGADLFVAIALCVISALTDARSDFAILMLTAALLVWQMRPKVTNRRGSAFMAVAGIAIVAVAIYNLGQALILDGFLGEDTQQRTARQISEAGNLILGGRPEMGATLNLMRINPWGFGSLTLPNYNDIRAAKSGMSFIGYDPANGYVERWMFADGYRLHSSFGDLWALYGIVGLIFAAMILGLTLRRLGTTLVSRTASGAMIFATGLLTWNWFFTPFYGGLRIAVLLLALTFVLRPPPPALAAVRRWS